MNFTLQFYPYFEPILRILIDHLIAEHLANPLPNEPIRIYESYLHYRDLYNTNWYQLAPEKIAPLNFARLTTLHVLSTGDPIVFSSYGPSGLSETTQTDQEDIDTIRALVKSDVPSDVRRLTMSLFESLQLENRGILDSQRDPHVFANRMKAQFPDDYDSVVSRTRFGPRPTYMVITDSFDRDAAEHIRLHKMRHLGPWWGN